MPFTASDILKIVAAVVLPPLGVFLEKGLCDMDVLINILLTILGYIPGATLRVLSFISARSFRSSCSSFSAPKLEANPGFLKHSYVTANWENVESSSDGVGCVCRDHSR